MTYITAKKILRNHEKNTCKKNKKRLARETESGFGTTSMSSPDDVASGGYIEKTKEKRVRQSC